MFRSIAELAKLILVERHINQISTKYTLDAAKETCFISEILQALMPPWDCLGTSNLSCFFPGLYAHCLAALQLIKTDPLLLINFDSF